MAAHRPQLDAALRYVRKGDVLFVTRMDRLARSVADLVAITKTLMEKGVGLRILSMNLDTASPTGKLMINLRIDAALTALFLLVLWIVILDMLSIGWRLYRGGTLRPAAEAPYQRSQYAGAASA